VTFFLCTRSIFFLCTLHWHARVVYRQQGVTVVCTCETVGTPPPPRVTDGRGWWWRVSEAELHGGGRQRLERSRVPPRPRTEKKYPFCGTDRVRIPTGYPCDPNCCPHNSCLRASPRVFFCLLPLFLCLFRRRHGTAVSVVTSSPPAVEHRESVLQLPSSCLQAAAPSSFSCRCRYWTAWGGDRFRFASISSFSW
jgi:hypothetical protein